MIGLRDGESRYRENKQVRLPKFISPKNPFATPGRNDQPVEAVEVKHSATTLVANAATQAGESSTSSLKETPARSARRGWLSVWGRRLNPFKSKGLAAKVAPNGGTPRQGEFALERVQVVRNDLSDAELRIGESTVKTGPILPVMAMTMEKLEPVGAVWSRLTTKFLGSDRG